MKAIDSKFILGSLILFLLLFTMALPQNALGQTYPQIISVSPSDRTDGVPLDSTIQIVFDQTMRPQAGFELNDQHGEEVGGVMTWSATTLTNDTLTFTPSGPLKPGMVYHIILINYDVWAVNHAACLNGGCSGYKSSFQTVALPGDMTPPSVMTTVPYAGETGVKLRNLIRVYFGEGMDKDSFTGGINVILTGSGITPSDYTVEYDFDAGIEGIMPILKINLSKNLSEFSDYVVNIGPSVTDISGNPMGANYSWTFTTGSADNTLPFIQGSVPAPGNTNFQGPVITLRFSESLRKDTVNTSNITLQKVSDLSFVPLYINNRKVKIGGRSFVSVSIGENINQLEDDTDYRISVSGIMDPEGNLISPVTIDFSTSSGNRTPGFYELEAFGINEVGWGSSIVEFCVRAVDYDGFAAYPDDLVLDVTASTATNNWTLSPVSWWHYCYESAGDEGMPSGVNQVDFLIRDSVNNSISITWPVMIFSGVPGLTGPPDGATGVSTTPTFSWDVTGISNVQWSVVEVANAAFETEWMGIRTHDGGTSYSMTVPPDKELDPCATYYWVVLLGDHHRVSRGEAVSEVRSFETDCSAGDDTDDDGIPDDQDNCVEVYNPDQRDSNSGEDDNTAMPGTQHYGDLCDPDYNNDGLVKLSDFSVWRMWFRSTVPPAPEYVDHDGDGLIKLSDFSIWRKYFRGAPGPGIGD